MELIKKYFPELTSVQLEQFAALEELYADWNSKINVISRKDMDSFYCNHVLHSLSLIKLKQLKHSDNVLDIGTGGGFPGIPLAIYYPEVHFTLVDSIRKKTTVVEAVRDELALKNVTVLNDRFENIKGDYNAIISRAVAPAIKLVQYTKNAIAKDGIYLFIKGGDLKDEKKLLLQKHKKSKWKEYSLQSFFSEPFFETKKAVVVTGIKG